MSVSSDIENFVDKVSVSTDMEKFVKQGFVVITRDGKKYLLTSPKVKANVVRHRTVDEEGDPDVSAELIGEQTLEFFMADDAGEQLKLIVEAPAELVNDLGYFYKNPEPYVILHIKMDSKTGEVDWQRQFMPGRQSMRYG